MKKAFRISVKNLQLLHLLQDFCDENKIYCNESSECDGFFSLVVFSLKDKNKVQAFVDNTDAFYDMYSEVKFA